MNNRKILSLSYFLGRTFFLGFGFSLLMKITKKDTWLAALLGIILGTIIIYFFSKLKEKINGSIKDVYKNKILKWLFVLVFFLYNIFVFHQILFIFQTFASSFFLIKSPIYFISLPVPFIIYRACKNGFSTIAKVAEVLMPISLFLFAFSFISLFQDLKLEYFTPILTTDSMSLLKGTLFFTAYSSAPYLLLLNAPMKETKLARKYFFSAITVFLICISIIGVLGPNLIQIYRYPEYMVLKKIKIFNFLEKVENIISIAWLFDLFIVLSISGNNLKECLPKKRQNLYFILILILLYFASIISGIYYQEELMLYYVLPIILGIFELVLLLFLLFSKKNKKLT